MPTTKKVAPVRRVRTKKVASAKKAVRPTRKETASKAYGAKKRRASVHSLSIKDNSKKRSDSDFHEKLQRFESLRSQKKDPVAKAIKPVSLVTKIAKSKQATATALALLSPYRFPVDAEKLATATARYSGIFFVVIGACFTLLYADATLNRDSLPASVLSTSGILEKLEPVAATNISTGTAGQETKIDCQSKDNFLNSLCASIVDQSPDVEISMQGGSLKDSVQLKVKVPFAQNVTLMAYSKTQKRELTLGAAKRISDDTWEMYWATQQYDDGEYKLKALIKNGYGSYEHSSDSYVTVANAKLEDAEEQTRSAVDSSGSSSDLSSSTALASVSAVALSISSPSGGTEFNMEIEATNAQKIKIYAQKKLTSEKVLLGYGYKASNSVWKYHFVPKGILQPGEYDIFAFALVNGRELGSNGVQVSVFEDNTAGDTLLAAPKSIIATTSQQVIAPKVALLFDASPLSKEEVITISVKDAASVELFLKPTNGLIQKYLGKALKADTDAWTYAWDTRLTPNGTYTLFVFVKNSYGTYNSQSQAFTVHNAVETQYTPKQTESVEALRSLESVAVNAETTPLPEIAKVEDPALPTTDILSSYNESIDKDLQRLAAALRSKDPDALARVNQRFDELKIQVKKSVGGSYDEEVLDGLLTAHLSTAIERTKEDVKRIEKVVLERTGEEVAKDSDNDGISDFDEINIYTTDPFSADSDQDGFTDGAEILSGFNPLDPASEASVAFESPKERGVVREDILKVEAVISAEKNDGQSEEGSPAAILSGKGLPNSFVTLYVFSTPVVVTVKTDEAGNWTYRFDKELEDGTHEVYVGVTDNAGRLVAKSEPFTFIKEAEAFSAAATTQTPPAPIVVERSMASQKMIYLVLSISVVAIGLVLILLGLYLERRQRQLDLTQTKVAI